MSESKTQSEEPPERDTATNLFLVGRDSHGHWVVQDQRGLCGGLFVDRSNAVHFAMQETGKQPQAIVMVPGVFELDMQGALSAANRAQRDQGQRLPRPMASNAGSSNAPMRRAM